MNIIHIKKWKCYKSCHKQYIHQGNASAHKSLISMATMHNWIRTLSPSLFSWISPFYYLFPNIGGKKKTKKKHNTWLGTCITVMMEFWPTGWKLLHKWDPSTTTMGEYAPQREPCWKINLIWSRYTSILVSLGTFQLTLVVIYIFFPLMLIKALLYIKLSWKRKKYFCLGTESEF